METSSADKSRLTDEPVVSAQNGAQPGGWWRIWGLGLATVALLGIFGALAEDVWMKESFSWDAPLMLAVHRLSALWLDQFMIFITRIGSPGLYLLTPLTILWLWRRRQHHAAIALAVSVAGAGLLSAALKIIFARPRPTVFPPLTVESTYSFPSGHTLVSIAYFGFIAYLLLQEKHRVAALIASLLALLIAVSRIYLGVHYPSDVLGSLSIGLLWLGVVIGGYRRSLKPNAREKKRASGSPNAPSS